MSFLQINGLGKVHYHEYGDGKKLLFAFHGYGMTGNQFSVLEKSLLKEYRVIGFDYFFQGTSVLEDETEASVLKGMHPELLKAYITTWFKQFEQQRFSLVGYSIGANMALFLLEHFAECIDEIFLMAPDGLVTHKGIQFLRASFIGKKIYKKLTYSSWMMVSALNFLKRINLIDHNLHTIACHEVETLQKRINAYFTVHFNKTIRPDIEKIAALINKYHIRCRLYFGRYDNLFPVSNSKKFISMLDHPELYVLPLGHWLVTTKLDQYIAKQNNDYQRKTQVIL